MTLFILADIPIALSREDWKNQMTDRRSGR